MIQRFEELNVWQLSRELVVDIYKLFEKNRDFDFKSQIILKSIKSHPTNPSLSKFPIQVCLLKAFILEISNLTQFPCEFAIFCQTLA